MDATDSELIEPKGGGLFLTLDELRNLCGAFDVFIVDHDADHVTLHYATVDRWFKCTARQGNKYGGWVASHAGHRHDVELRLALGLPETPLKPTGLPKKAG